jgi:hypothetical protein
MRITNNKSPVDEMTSIVEDDEDINDRDEEIGEKEDNKSLKIGNHNGRHYNLKGRKRSHCSVEGTSSVHSGSRLSLMQLKESVQDEIFEISEEENVPSEERV